MIGLSTHPWRTPTGQQQQQQQQQQKQQQKSKYSLFSLIQDSKE